MTTITVLGVGPGDPDLLTLKAKDAIAGADVVAGFETVLKPISRWIKGETLPMRYRDQEEVLDVVAARAAEGKKCVVCAWGDLNFSARELVERVQRRVDETVLIPGPYELMPAGIAKMLLERGVSPQLSMHVLQRLCHDDESMQEYTLGALAEEEAEFSDLTIMVFPRV